MNITSIILTSYGEYSYPHFEGKDFVETGLRLLVKYSRNFISSYLIIYLLTIFYLQSFLDRSLRELAYL